MINKTDECELVYSPAVYETLKGSNLMRLTPFLIKILDLTYAEQEVLMSVTWYIVVVGGAYEWCLVNGTRSSSSWCDPQTVQIQ